MARAVRILKAPGSIEETLVEGGAESSSLASPPAFFSVEVYRRDARTFVAACPEMDVFSYGRTIDQAVERLKRIVAFYLESADEMGLSLEELGLKGGGDPNAPKFPRVSQYKELASLH